jgi:hypothetical protein
MSAIIHGAKIFKSVKNGVMVFDCKVMVKRFIANTWYTYDKLDEILNPKGYGNKIKSR